MEIENLAKGIEPQRPEPLDGQPVPTTGGDTILRIPPNGGDDRQLILEACRAVAAVYVETQQLPDALRREAITQRLAALNTADPSAVNPDHGKMFEFKSVT